MAAKKVEESDEMVEIFKQGTPAEKKKVTETLVAVDPTHSDRYESIGE